MEQERRHNADVIVERLDNFISQNTLDHQELKNTLSDVKTQTTQTNGRVRKLEMWRTFLLGAWTVISFVAVVVVPFAVNYYVKSEAEKTQREIDIQVHKAITAKLQELNIEVVNE